MIDTPEYMALRVAIEQAKLAILAAAASLKQSENYVGIDGIFADIDIAQEHLLEALAALEPEVVKPDWPLRVVSGPRDGVERLIYERVRNLKTGQRLAVGDPYIADLGDAGRELRADIVVLDVGEGPEPGQAWTVYERKPAEE